jgi:hypothetical protein
MITKLINKYIKSQFAKEEAPEELLDAIADGLRMKHRNKINKQCSVMVVTMTVDDEGRDLPIEEFEMYYNIDR